MKTNLRILAENFSTQQFISITNPSFYGVDDKERNLAWQKLTEEIDRVEKILENVVSFGDLP